MAIFRLTAKRIFFSLYKPEALFLELSPLNPKELRTQTTRIFLVFFVLVLIFVLTGNFIGQFTKSAIEYELSNTPSLLQLQGIQSKYFPFLKLSFPIVWIVYGLMAGLIRFLFMKILGEKNLTLPKVICLGFYSVSSLILFCAIGNVLLEVFPLVPTRTTFSILLQTGIGVILFFLGFFVEARTYVFLSKGFFEQNTGRAVLTWSIPSSLFFILVFLIIVFYFSLV
ncbi:MAG: hypothetical protein SFU98_02455 [Leptospiraceae bacterium]|nr:hypothetical protein [Leptospiraceae bacterium]